MTGNRFVEDYIAGKVVLACHITDTPSNSVVFVANEDSFVSSGATFRSQFRGDGRKALAPPYTEM